MPNSFIFIIPLTPASHLTPLRLGLQKLCFETLASQTYANWQALVVGGATDFAKHYKNVVPINFEGFKEEKLQVATKYILDSNLKCDYIIRLDDDNIFNPTLLKELATIDFDLYADKYHTFWDVSTGLITQQVPYWFANTCIHKKEHALAEFGKFHPADAGKDYKKFKERPFLIENGHADFHLYYKESHKVLFAKKNNPVYVRALNPDSHSSVYSGNYREYMNLYGYWRSNKLAAFQFLRQFRPPVAVHYSKKKQGLLFRIKNEISNLLASYNYNKVVRKKKLTQL